MHAWCATDHLLISGAPKCRGEKGHDGHVYIEAIRRRSSLQVDECGERLAVQMVRPGPKLWPSLLLHCEYEIMGWDSYLDTV